ncbi:DUF5753 domain-containing protein [Streptomyces sp. SP17KL33]|uniref:DUF5753 domain-containing protein n=1 Tax=Streptomyces sp. SP17KL33 TaxID=3002534 RepID=UPI003FCE298A
MAAAEVLGVDPARVSRIESRLVTARILEIRVLLNAYGEEDPEVRSKLEDLAKRSKHRGRWLEHAAHLRPDYLDHISLEDDATHSRVWAQALVPGLLQPPAYAEAVITASPSYVAPDRVGQMVKVREARQAKIQEGGAAYTAIIWEPVVIHPLVRAEIHREQLEQILEVGRRKNVTVQVLPLSAGTLAGEPAGHVDPRSARGSRRLHPCLRPTTIGRVDTPPPAAESSATARTPAAPSCISRAPDGTLLSAPSPGRPCRAD